MKGKCSVPSLILHCFKIAVPVHLSSIAVLVLTLKKNHFITKDVIESYHWCMLKPHNSYHFCIGGEQQHVKIILVHQTFKCNVFNCRKNTQSWKYIIDAHC